MAAEEFLPPLAVLSTATAGDMLLGLTDILVMIADESPAREDQPCNTLLGIIAYHKHACEH